MFTEVTVVPPRQVGLRGAQLFHQLSRRHLPDATRLNGRIAG
jgi:hypothetical protein